MTSAAAENDPVVPSVFQADTASGWCASPRGGLTDPLQGHRHPAGGGGAVREAVEADLPALGAVHASTMLASLEAAHQEVHGEGLPAGVAAMISAPVLAAGWEQAVIEPPSPQHHVLVATVGEELVGLIGLAPTHGSPAPAETAPASDAAGAADPGATENEPVAAVELIALGVAPGRQRHGHGSRLLAAASDLARQAGAEVMLMWAVRGDESVARFLDAVGMRPTRSHRKLPIGQGVTEDCWAAVL